MTEAEMIKCALPYFDKMGFKVYKEVQFGGNTIDIVLTKGQSVIAVEGKLGLGLDGMYQAKNWIHYATRSALLIPAERPTALRVFKQDLCLFSIGIDLIQIVPKLRKPEDSTIEWMESPRVFDRNTAQMIKALHPEQLKGEAGHQSPERSTNFKRTCAKIVELIKTDGACSVSYAVKQIESHHYKNDGVAIRALVKLGEENKAVGIYVNGLDFYVSNGAMMIGLSPGIVKEKVEV